MATNNQRARETFPDYYCILGVAPSANFETIKKAYKQCAFRSHPDRGGSHEAMLLINEAFSILGNAETRQRYDEARQQFSSEQARRTASDQGERARQKASDYPREWNQFESWFDAFANDVANARYGSTKWGGVNVPTVQNSTSGMTFLVVGGLGGLIAAVAWGSANNMHGLVWKFLVIGGIAGGAWAGQFIHQVIGGGSSSQQRTNVGTGQSQSIEIEPIVTTCPKCSQKLRVRPFTDWPSLKCNNCQQQFQFLPSSAYSAGIELWKSQPTRSQAKHWIRIAAQAGHDEAKKMARLQGIEF
ncbi:MAG: hypothetical protein JWM68_1368 [Verrucomicrobiales bacterium]|nr:hypothetical protein [Verrucomicrobiales bacterium]